MAAVIAELRGIPSKVNRVLRTAANDTAKTLRSDLSKNIRELVNIKKADIDPYLKVTPPQGASVEIRIKEGARIPLRFFGARETKAGVTYKISRRGGRNRIPSAFIVKKFASNVYTRKSANRGPFLKPRGVSAWGVVGVNKLDAKAVRDGQAIFRKNIMRRLNLEVLRAKGLAR